MTRPTQVQIIRLAGLTTLSACALILFFTQPKTEEAVEPVTILPGPFVLRVTPRDRFVETFRRGGRWAARAEQAFFGKRKLVAVSAEIIQFSAAACTNLESTLNLGTPTFNQTNALKIWFFGERKMKEIGQKISRTPGMETLTHPRLQMGDGMSGSVFMGQTVTVNGKPVEVGFSMRCAPTVHEDSTEMLTEIVQSELSNVARRAVLEDLTPLWTMVAGVQTNLEINARLNVPHGKGIFLVKWPGDKATNGWGVVVHPLR